MLIVWFPFASFHCWMKPMSFVWDNDSKLIWHQKTIPAINDEGPETLYMLFSPARTVDLQFSAHFQFWIFHLFAIPIWESIPILTKSGEANIPRKTISCGELWQFESITIHFTKKGYSCYMQLIAITRDCIEWLILNIIDYIYAIICYH